MEKFEYPKQHVGKGSLSRLREVVFGMQDGMVSTLGAVIGIAAGSGESLIVVLSGLVIIAVESISMGIGSFVSNKIVADTTKRSLEEEKMEIKHYPEKERKELASIYKQDGWPDEMAEKMAEVASFNRKLFLNEMKYHEHGIYDIDRVTPFKNGLAMFFSYIVGGFVPLFAFLFLSLNFAMPAAVAVTFAGLFMLGVFTSVYSKRKWWKAGLELFILGVFSSSTGYLIGYLFDKFIL